MKRKEEKQKNRGTSKKIAKKRVVKIW